MERHPSLLDHTFEGNATFIENHPLIINRHGKPEPAYFTFCYSYLRNESGEIVGVLDTVIENIEARKKLKLLNGELTHRIKTRLRGSMQSRGKHCVRRRRSKKLKSRLAAVSQNALNSSSGSGASINAIAENVLAPFDIAHQRATFIGSSILLSTIQSVSLSLAPHELATKQRRMS